MLGFQDAPQKVEKIVSRVSTIIQQLSTAVQAPKPQTEPSPKLQPPAESAPEQAAPPTAERVTVAFPELDFATPPRPAKTFTQQPKTSDPKTADSHSQLTSEDTVSTIPHQQTPMSATTVRSSPFCANPPQPHPYPYDIRMHYQAFLPEGSADENSTSSESFADSSAEQMSTLSSIHAADATAMPRSAADELLYQEEYVT